MKVKIRNYSKWVPLYTVVQKAFFWTATPDKTLPFVKNYPEWVDNLADKVDDSVLGKVWRAVNGATTICAG